MSKLKKHMDLEKNLCFFSVSFCGLACILFALFLNQSQRHSMLLFEPFCLLLIAITAVILKREGKLNTSTLTALIFMAGFISRICYISYTVVGLEFSVRQHDLGSFGGKAGHSVYIEYFYNNGFKLPDFDPRSVHQFYHPPLHHMISALWMRILTFIGYSYEYAAAAIQYQTLFYSCVCMFVTERILRELKIGDKGVLIGTAVIAFHPTFIILAGSINNDMLSLMFVWLSIYFALKWNNQPKLIYIIITALTVGLGMSSKLSASFVAVPIAIIFLFKLFGREDVQIKKSRIVGQFCLFGLVCIPLGMWFYVRNYLKFGVPFNFIIRLSEDNPQYVGGFSVYQRFLDFSQNPLNHIFLNKECGGVGFYEYNPVIALFKTSLFGEYDFSLKFFFIEPICKVLFYLNILIVAVSAAAMVYYLIKKNKYIKLNLKIAFTVWFIFSIVNYFSFCFQYPHTCTMDFRYIVPCLLIGVIFFAMLADDIGEIKEKQEKKTAIVLYRGIIAGVSSFSTLSILIYYIYGLR